MSEPTLRLDYGRAAVPRWRQWVRQALVAALWLAVFFTAVAGLWLAGRWYLHREGVREVTAWMARARTATLPPGTILYSERAAERVGVADATEDSVLAVRHHVGKATGSTFRPHDPNLRTLGIDARGMPTMLRGNVVYAHEHPLLEPPAGARPFVLAVTYWGIDSQGLPMFHLAAARSPVQGEGAPYIEWFATARATPRPARPLSNLRVFAGQPDPADLTRFSVPFECAGGAGRFEFDTDDGDRGRPSVAIVWDDAATRPTTGAADAR